MGLVRMRTDAHEIINPDGNRTEVGISTYSISYEETEALGS